MPHKQSKTCAIAAALNILGDKWSLLIVREAFYGSRRFGEFLKNTGISRNLLTERLGRLVEEGILERIEFADRGTSFAYALSDKGYALETVMVSLQQWSNKHIFGEGNEPVISLEKKTGKPIPDLTIRNSSGKKITHKDILMSAGPGADEKLRSRLVSGS